ncbi:MAG: hypothetical protein BGO76_08215 [Caedibacter sp. 38-128]|nr:MAG: hypothetical protein BGO76_08215 [Caedibacter sp. 38-128]
MIKTQQEAKLMFNKSIYQKIKGAIFSFFKEKKPTINQPQKSNLSRTKSDSGEGLEKNLISHLCISGNPYSQKTHLKDKKCFLNIKCAESIPLTLKGPLIMKQYLLLTTAFLSLVSISYASDDQDEKKSLALSVSQLQTDPQSEIQAIIKKYAPHNLARNTFNGLKTENHVTVNGISYRFWVPGESEENDQVIKEAFKATLPSSYAVLSNKKQVLNVLDAFPDLKRNSVVITFQYDEALITQAKKWLSSDNTLAQGYVFNIEAVLEPADATQLKKLIPTIKAQSNAEMQKLEAVIAKLTEENAQLLQSVTNANAIATASNSFAPPPPPSGSGNQFAPPPPPPPAPGTGKGSIAKTKKVVILSPEYQPHYDALDENVKEKVSAWKQATIEFYLKVLTEKGDEQAKTFLDLDEMQIQKVLKMSSYSDKISYLNLTSEARKKRDDEEAEKAQKLADSSAKQGDMLAELLSKRTLVSYYEPEVKKEEESKTIDSSTPSFAQALEIKVSDKEQLAFENAQKLWSAVSLPRKKQVLDFFPNDIILKGILLKTINGEVVTLDSNKQGQYTAPTILKSGVSLLRQQKETSEEFRFTAESIRDLSVYALLNAKAIGINATQIKPVIEELRKQTF